MNGNHFFWRSPQPRYSQQTCSGRSSQSSAGETACSAVLHSTANSSMSMLQNERLPASWDEDESCWTDKWGLTSAYSTLPGDSGMSLLCTVADDKVVPAELFNATSGSQDAEKGMTEWSVNTSPSASSDKFFSSATDSADITSSNSQEDWQTTQCTTDYIAAYRAINTSHLMTSFYSSDNSIHVTSFNPLQTSLQSTGSMF